MRLGQVAFAAFFVLSSGVRAQGRDAVRDRVDAWFMLGAQDPMTDSTVWLPYMWSPLIRRSPDGRLNVDDDGPQLTVQCTPGDSSVTIAGAGPRGESWTAGEVRVRFDSLPPLPPETFERLRSGHLRLYVEHNGFLSAARRRTFVVIQIGDSNYRYALLGFTTMYDRCKRRGRRTT